MSGTAPVVTSKPPRRNESGQPHTRRPGACIPCRQSKSKCDGGSPCGTCTTKRHKPSCTYVSKATDSDNRDVESIGNQSGPESSSHDTNDQSIPHQTNGSQGAGNSGGAESSADDFFGPFSICKCLDQFKSLLPFHEPRISEIISYSYGSEAFQQPNHDVSSSSTTTTMRHDLRQNRMTSPSNQPGEVFFFAHDTSHTASEYLIHFQNRILYHQHLIQTGNILQSWQEFPTLVREAELKGFDRHGKLSKTPSSRENDGRLRVWWNILELDAQLSLHTGRPLQIRGVNGISRPMLNDLPDESRGLEDSRLDLKQCLLDVLDHVALQERGILSSSAEDANPFSTTLYRLERIKKVAAQLSCVDMSDSALPIAIADHQLETNLCLMVLYCYLSSRPLPINSPKEQSDNSADDEDVNWSPSKSGRRKQRNQKYHKEILQSARQVLESFNSIHETNRMELSNSWTRCFAAYIAASILAIARLRQDVELQQDFTILQQTLITFEELLDTHPDAHLYQLARHRLKNLLGGTSVSLSPIVSDMDRSHQLEQAHFWSNFQSEYQGSVPFDADAMISTSAKEAGRGKRPVPEDDSEIHRGRSKRQRVRQQSLHDESGALNRTIQWPSSQEMVMPIQVNHPAISTAGPPVMGPTDYHPEFEAPYPVSATTSFNGDNQLEYGVHYSAVENVHYDAPQNQMDPTWHPPLHLHPPMMFDQWSTQEAPNYMSGGQPSQPAFATPMMPHMVSPMGPLNTMGGEHFDRHIGSSSQSVSPRGDIRPVDHSTPTTTIAHHSTMIAHNDLGQHHQFYDNSSEQITPDDQHHTPPIDQGKSHGQRSRFSAKVANAATGGGRRRSVMDMNQQQPHAQQSKAPWPADGGIHGHSNGMSKSNVQYRDDRMKTVYRDEYDFSRRHSSPASNYAPPLNRRESLTSVPVQTQQSRKHASNVLPKVPENAPPEYRQQIPICEGPPDGIPPEHNLNSVVAHPHAVPVMPQGWPHPDSLPPGFEGQSALPYHIMDRAPMYDQNFHQMQQQTHQPIVTTGPQNQDVQWWSGA